MVCILNSEKFQVAARELVKSAIAPAFKALKAYIEEVGGYYILTPSLQIYLSGWDYALSYQNLYHYHLVPLDCFIASELDS